MYKNGKAIDKMSYISQMFIFTLNIQKIIQSNIGTVKRYNFICLVKVVKSFNKN